ncbi:MAG: TIGR03016 family PEP-CTERM system-associated outer membrane protein [Desulfuromonadales bacterium]
MKSIGKLALLSLLAVLCSLATIGDVRAEYRLYPSLAISEIYDDNLFNDETDKVDEFITRFMPSLTLDYQQARIDTNLIYTYDYRWYLHGEREDEGVHFLDFLTLLNLQERYYLEIADSMARVSLSSTRDYGEESLFENQSDQNIFSVSPYVRLPLSTRASLRTGYKFTITTYDDGGNDKTNHQFFVEQSYELSNRTDLSAGYIFLDEDTDEIDFDKHDVYGGLRHEFGENSFVFATLGHTWIDFSNGFKQSDFFWDFGLTRDFTLLSATAGIGVSYTEDPEGTVLRDEHCSLSLTRDWTRSRVAVSASLNDFYDADIDVRDTRRYGGAGTYYHELGSRWTGTLMFSGYKYEEDFEDTWTRRFIGSVALAYLLAEDFTSTLSYYRIDSHSPQVAEDRFETNRVFLEFRKVF